jgi:hypothetical protein
MPQAGARSRSALASGLPGRVSVSEPSELCMVRRRSTVRFRKGAPSSDAFFEINIDSMRVIHKIINFKLIKPWPAATQRWMLDDHDRE